MLVKEKVEMDMVNMIAASKGLCNVVFNYGEKISITFKTSLLLYK